MERSVSPETILCRGGRHYYTNRDNLRGAMAARLYNDRGYIRYEMPNASENAKRDLERAVDLHHQALALTLLNLSIISIDSQDYAQAIEKIETPY